MRRYYVYKVTNKVNGKIYIGRTIDFFKRITQHCKESESATQPLHKDFLEFDISNFTWEILCIVDSKEKADAKEREYIKKFNSTEPNGYNRTLGGTGGVSSKTRAILCFEQDGTMIKRYESASQTLNDGYFIHGVIDCCEHKAVSCHGKIFMYEDEFFKKGFIKRERGDGRRHNAVVQCDLNGNKINEYESVATASAETGVTRSCISSCITGRQKTANGFIFVYKEDYPIKDLSKRTVKTKGRKVIQIDPKTGKTLSVYKSIAEAGRTLNVNYKAIQRVVDMDGRTAYGYGWKSL